MNKDEDQIIYRDYPSFFNIKDWFNPKVPIIGSMYITRYVVQFLILAGSISIFEDSSSLSILLLVYILDLVSIYWIIVNFIKRLKDMGGTGIGVLLVLVPIVNAVMIIYWIFAKSKIKINGEWVLVKQANHNDKVYKRPNN